MHSNAPDRFSRKKLNICRRVAGETARRQRVREFRGGNFERRDRIERGGKFGGRTRRFIETNNPDRYRVRKCEMENYIFPRGSSVKISFHDTSHYVTVSL